MGVKGRLLVVYVSSDAPQITPAQLEACVEALQIQVRRDFQQYYMKNRVITLTTIPTPGAWHLHVTAQPIYYRGKQVAGYHYPAGTHGPQPGAFAFAPETDAAPTGIMGHELLEMLADPTTHGREICDKFVDHWYFINGMFMVDFGLPDGNHWCGVNKCSA